MAVIMARVENSAIKKIFQPFLLKSNPLRPTFSAFYDETCLKIEAAQVRASALVISSLGFQLGGVSEIYTSCN